MKTTLSEKTIGPAHSFAANPQQVRAARSAERCVKISGWEAEANPHFDCSFSRFAIKIPALLF
jgi:hypothetical protein